MKQIETGRSHTIVGQIRVGGNGPACVATMWDDDGHVNIIDRLILLDSWGMGLADGGYSPACDFSRDGTIDLADPRILTGD